MGFVDSGGNTSSIFCIILLNNHTVDGLDPSKLIRYPEASVTARKTLVSDMRNVSKFLVPGLARPILCRDRIPLAQGMAACVRVG